MKKIYVAMAYRGINGDRATAEEIEQNLKKAEQVRQSLVRRFPEVDWYFPHFDPDLQCLNDAWLAADDREPLTREIMQKCFGKLDECDALLSVGYVYGGVSQEIERCWATNKPYDSIEWDSEYWEYDVANLITEITDDRATSKCD